MAGDRPKVGVGVLVFKGAHGEGFYCGPGGHLEFGETLEECASREVQEEAGIRIKNIRPIAFINFLVHQKEGYHYFDVGMAADWESGEPRNLEPEKRDGWGWYDPVQLPAPLWEQIPLYFKSFKTGTMYHGTIK